MPSVIHVTAGLAAAALGIASLLAAVPNETRETTVVARHPDSAAVASAVTRFHNAISMGDSTAALALLAPDAVVLESGGMETRSKYRFHHLPGDISFARAVKSVRTPIKVTFAGSTALTVSTSTAQGEFNGRAINSIGAESIVLSKTSAGWRIRSIHWSSRSRRPSA